MGVVRGLTALEPAQHVSCGYCRFQNIDIDTVKQETLLINPDRTLDMFSGCWNIARHWFAEMQCLHVRQQVPD